MSSVALWGERDVLIYASMLAPIVGLILIVSLLVGGVFIVKMVDQAAKDRKRKTYRLAFPPELDAELVTAWIRSLHGILRPKPFDKYISGSPSIVLELWSKSGEISYRLRVPYGYEPPVRHRLESLIPGVQLIPEKDTKPREWLHAVELKLRAGHRPLDIKDAAHISTSIVSNFTGVAQGETMMVQFVVTPTPREHKPIHGETSSRENTLWAALTGTVATKDEINDRRNKLDEPNMRAAIRVGASARTKARASTMVRYVVSSFAATGTAASYFSESWLPVSQVSKNINVAHTPMSTHVQLAAPELTALLGWPIGQMNLPGMPAPVSRRLPVPSSVLTDGIRIGTGNYAGRERPVTVGIKELMVHSHIAAPPGKGKTVLLANKAKQIMEAGLGLIAIEAKGDLFNAILDYVPPERIHDVVIVDLNDTMYPVGWNPLDQGTGPMAVSEVISVIQQWYSDFPSLWAPEYMHHGMHALSAYKKASITDLLAVLTPMKDEVDWAYAVRNSVTNDQQLRWWQEFENMSKSEQSKRVGPLNSRFWPLTQSRLLSVLGQEKSTFYIRDIIRENKILLVNLSGVEVDVAKLFGTLMISAIRRAAWDHPMPHSPNVLMLDEGHHYVNLPLDLQLMFVEARSKGLGIDFAHQGMWQLPPAIKQAINIATQTKVFFQTSGDDTREYAKVLGQPITDHDIASLGQYEAIARVATPTGMSPPLTMNTISPAKGYGLAQQIIYASRGRYGRPVNEVMEEIRTRRQSPATSSRNRPAPDMSGWGGL